MKKAIYPGTFDPITNGHIDILKKAAQIFDKVILAVAEHTGKKTTFTISEREELCKKATANMERIEVKKFDGLSVNFAKKENAATMIRGLRAVSDFEYELSLTLMNKKLSPNMETIFFVPESEYLYLSSTMVRQIVTLGGDVRDLIPKCIEKAIINKYKKEINNEKTTKKTD